jgi:predicted phosphodiesterase
MQKIVFDDNISDISLIGDIHGDYEYYDKVASRLEATIQLGDFGFEFDVLKNHDPKHHMVLGGNHDNYANIVHYPNYLGDFGTIKWKNYNMFFVRGAFSIDVPHRTMGVDWWPEEELSYLRMNECMECYREQKPDILITHCPPKFAVEWFVKPIMFSKTERFFDELYLIHKPKMHIFGHMHHPAIIDYNGTKFVSVGINQILNFKTLVERL